MKIYFLLLLALLSFNLSADEEISCPTPKDIVESSLDLQDFRDLCNVVVKTDPGCQSVKPELMMNCEGGQDENKLLSNSFMLEKIGGCLKGLFIDSLADLGNLIVEMISTLVDVNIKSAKGMYNFFADEKYRAELISKFQNSGSESGKLISSFFRMSAAYFSQNFSRNLKESYYNPMIAIPKTFFEPFVKFLASTVQGMAEQYVSEFNCLNGPAKANSICKMIGDVLMPPTAFFAYLKGSKAAILMMKNMKKGKGVVESIKATHNSLNILKASAKLKDPERIAEAARVLGKEFEMTEAKAKALIEAHKVGLERGYFKYTAEDIEKKAKILKEAGFTKAERRILMDRGLVGGTGEEILAAAKEANTRASALSIEAAKLLVKKEALSPDQARTIRMFEQELKSAAAQYENAALLAKSPTTLSKSWAASLKAGDTEAAYKTAVKGMKELNMSPQGILRNLNENLEAKLLKAKSFPDDPILEMEIKSIRRLQERIAKEVPATAPSIAAPKPAAAAPVAAPKPVSTPGAPAAKPAPVQAARRAPENMTPREAVDEGHKLRLKNEPEAASEYFLRGAQKRTLEDRNFSEAIEQSMRGEGKVAVQIIRDGKKDPKLLNEIIYDFNEQQIQYHKSQTVKDNLKKLVDEIDSDPELKAKLYTPQMRILDSLRKWTR